MKHLSRHLAAGLLGLGLLTLVSAVPTPATAAPGVTHDRPVIVDVDGDAANGFEITYADGASIFPPTDSEARAECSEYDTGLARVRCRVEVRTWYRDLGDLQTSLAFVREHG